MMSRSIPTLLLLLLAACASDDTVLTKVHYADLPHWAADRHDEPLELFKQSCEANEKRPQAWQTKASDVIVEAAPWKALCARAESTPRQKARQFFEQHFTPYRVASEQYPQGRITGYYEPVLSGSLKRGGRYQTPVYGVPTDVSVRGASRAEIEAGALANKAPVIAYVDDPVMLFFLHIQGSGKLRLKNGQLIGLQYAGQNGHPYTAIGKILRDDYGLEEISMQTIRDWLYQNPECAAEVMNQNASYVFFKRADGRAYAKGALGVPLTPLRSIAVDNARATYGVPTYIVTTRHDYHRGSEQHLARLFVAQDTGGALKGPHRADIFFGRGVAEEWSAGQQNALGDVYWLLPKALEPLLDKAAAS